MQAFDTSVIVRTRRKLLRCPDLRVTSGRYWLRVDRPADGGFPIHLRVHARHFSVHLGGWSRRFDRDDDAMDCVEFGLSPTCRLLVEYRGSVEVAWTVEARGARHLAAASPHGAMARPILVAQADGVLAESSLAPSTLRRGTGDERYATLEAHHSAWETGSMADRPQSYAAHAHNPWPTTVATVFVTVAVVAFIAGEWLERPSLVQLGSTRWRCRCAPWLPSAGCTSRRCRTASSASRSDCGWSSCLLPVTPDPAAFHQTARSAAVCIGSRSAGARHARARRIPFSQADQAGDCHLAAGL